MEVKVVLLVFLALLMTSSSGTRDGDLLQSACAEACQEWEEWRKQCFNASCQKYVEAGQDWFPCYLACWDKVRSCVAMCADTFWTMYSHCSHQCLELTARKRSRCRHRCIVKKFAKTKQFIAPPPLSRTLKKTGAKRRTAHAYT